MNKRIGLMMVAMFCLFARAGGKHVLLYGQIDSVSRTIRAASPDLLAKQIQSRFSDPEDRVRAAFAWMSWQIAYDVDGYFHTSTLYNPQWPSGVHDSATRENLFIKNVAARVFRERKAICAGYSKLFMYLMQQMGIESKSVIGFGKTEIRKSGTRFSSNHEWNLVKIKGEWKLVDVTWAAGYTDFGKRKFNREYNDHYFFTDPGLMLVDHYPANRADALLSRVPTFDQFITRPMVYRDFWKLNPTQFFASDGFLKTSDSALILGFKSPVQIERIQFSEGSNVSPVMLVPVAGETVYEGKNFVTEKMDGSCRIRYAPASRSKKKIIVFINGRAVMEFLQE